MSAGFLVLVSVPVARIQHWPGINNGYLIGIIVMIIGAFIFIAGLKRKEV